MSFDTTPIYGCSGCETTGGRMSCAVHGPNGEALSRQAPSDEVAALRSELAAERERADRAEHMYRGEREVNAVLLDELASAKLDTERLDWLITILWVVEMDERGWYMRDPEDDHIVAGFWKTPREAIDAARAEGEQR